MATIPTLEMYHLRNIAQNGTKEQIATIVDNLNKGNIPSSADVVVCPTYVHLEHVKGLLTAPVKVAAQNVWTDAPGAWTGEVSAEILRDLGIEWVVIGHSERRHVIKETNEMQGKKTKKALDTGLNVIACVGEQLEDREAGKTTEVVFSQLKAFADNTSEWGKVVIAYEPVWAIGTGKTASPEQAQEVHQQIRGWLADNVSKGVAESTRIIYGGSVNGKNATDLAQQPDLDGFLVGGASLKPEFVDIIKAIAN